MSAFLTHSTTSDVAVTHGRKVPQGKYCELVRSELISSATEVRRAYHDSSAPGWPAARARDIIRTMADPNDPAPRTATFVGEGGGGGGGMTWTVTGCSVCTKVQSGAMCEIYVCHDYYYLFGDPLRVS